MNRRELDRAIQNALDGALAESERDELRAALKADPEARALYYEYAALHQSLGYRLSRFTPVDAAKSLASARIELQRRRTIRFVTAIAASVMLVGVITLGLIFVPNEPALATYRSAPNTLYTIKHTDSGGSSSGDGFGKGAVVRITQGSFEFEHRNGTQAVILAPAEFEFETEDRLRLRSGTAWFKVSPDGTGFRVRTPELDVTDLGTEFGIVADSSAGDEVHVFTGRVEARGSRDGSSKETIETLDAGQARSVGLLGKLEEISPDPDRFLTQLPEDDSSNLLFNGDFEAGTRPDDADFGSMATAALLPGWSFGSDIVVTLNSSTGKLGHGKADATILSSTADTQVAFRNGRPFDYEVSTPDDSIWQTFTTVPNRQYEVSFEMGGFFVEAGNLRVSAAVHDGTASSGSPIAQTSASRSGKDYDDNGYNPPTKIIFTAQSNQTTLVLTETSPDTDLCSPAIDNVSVRELP